MDERDRARLWLIFLAGVATQQIATEGILWPVAIAYLVIFVAWTTMWALVFATD